MMISLHIPKTAGTTFRRLLDETHPGKVALYYGKEHPLTHALLKGPDDLGAAAARLEKEGIEILHGHFRARDVQAAFPDPGSYVTFLRDPVDRIVSNFQHFRRKPDPKNVLGAKVHSGEVDLIGFASDDHLANAQSEYLKPFKVQDLKFVGLTERFRLSLRLIFPDYRAEPQRFNEAPERPTTLAGGERKRIAQYAHRDVLLYAEACERFADAVTAKELNPAAAEWARRQSARARQHIGAAGSRPDLRAAVPG